MSKIEKVELTAEEKEIAELEALLKEAQEDALKLDKNPDKLKRLISEQKQKNEEERAFERACAQHGRENVGRINTQLGMLLVKRGNVDLWDMWQDHVNAQSAKDEPYENANAAQFIKSCRLYPEAKRFDEILDNQPAALRAGLVAMAKLYGGLQLF